MEKPIQIASGWTNSQQVTLTFLSSSPVKEVFCTGDAVKVSLEDWVAVRDRVTAGIRVRNQLRMVAQTQFKGELNRRP